MTSNVIAVVFALAYYAVTIWLCRGVRLDVRSLSFAAVIIALTLVLSSIMIPLPTGAAITAGSWIPLMVLALVYDFRLAFIPLLTSAGLPMHVLFLSQARKSLWRNKKRIFSFSFLFFVI